MAKMDEGADLEFRWLKKRGVGGKKKEISFYESFIYDGVMYTLYDCVYMYKEGLSEPYIGKLIKIWEHSDKTRKVKVHWFFRIEEISQWLGDAKTLEKEILLASGEGVGLANVNPLEAIAGHCNVVCVSKDCRNPQPSDEELKAADYVFYRSFDVQSCTVLDKMDDKVGGLEIQYIFNRKKSENASTVPKLNPVKEEENRNTTSNEPHQILTKAPSDKPDTVKVDGSTNQLTVEVDGKGDSQGKDVQNSLVGRESVSAVEPCSEAAMDSCKVGASAEKGNTDRCIVNSDKVKMKKVPVNQVEAKERNKTMGSKALNGGSLKTEKADNDEVKVSELPVNKVETKEKNISPANSDKLQGRPSKQNKADNSFKSPEGQQVEVNKKNSKTGMDSDKSKDMSSNKAKIDDSIKLPVDDESKHEEKSPLHHDEGKAIVTSDTNKEKPDHRNGKNLLGPDKEVTPTRIIGDLEGRTLKKAKVGNSSKVSDNNKDSAVQKLTTSIKGKNGKDSIAAVAFNKNENAVQKPNANIQGQNGKDAIATVTPSEEESNSRLALGSLEINEEPSREHLGERKRKLSLGKSPTPSSAIGEFKRPKNQEIVVKPKPNTDKNNWFKTLPWDDRLQGAYDQGTVVLLHNLDSGYTSREVEDIIWNALKEKCDAKMLQRTALSSPHSGQALILLKTKEATERVLERLDKECLMLPNGRPLVGTSCPAISSRKQSKFFGHLVIPKLKTQNQREMDEAVSTSHPSQPNTIEYEMAMEWCLQHSRSEKWWEAIYKRQLDELRKLEANLKRK